MRRVAEEDREESRDRRIFDRIAIVERTDRELIGPRLRAEAARLRKKYPNWKIAEGEQAHFSFWIGNVERLDAPVSLLELKNLSDDQLLQLLTSDTDRTDRTDNVLEQWRRFAADDPSKAIRILRGVPTKGPRIVALWRYALWGIRDASTEAIVRNALLEILEQLPRAVLSDAEVAERIADILEGWAAEAAGDVFWRVFDRVLPVIVDDPRNSERPSDNDWVSLAINRSMGRLATAFLNAMFKRQLNVGDGIPSDLRDRLDSLLGGRRPSNRLARVIASSRLSYLYAIDPDWAAEVMIPLFDWSESNDEALAAWQGYSWQPRLDRKLWGSLKPVFLQTFTTERLNQLGDASRMLAQILMLVGVEFGQTELPRDKVRNAIRTMSDGMRSEAISWIKSYVAQRDDAQADAEGEHGSDLLWRDHVRPWLERVWPPEPQLRSEGIATQFMLLAIATKESFPEAVAFVLPHIIPTGGHYEITILSESDHPDRHPGPTLDLIDAGVDPVRHWYDDAELRVVLNRIVQAAPVLAQSNIYRVWDERLRAVNA
jgi:hypothetical protein